MEHMLGPSDDIDSDLFTGSIRDDESAHAKAHDKCDDPRDGEQHQSDLPWRGFLQEGHRCVLIANCASTIRLIPM